MPLYIFQKLKTKYEMFMLCYALSLKYMYMYLYVDIIIEIIHYVLNTLITNKAASILVINFS